MVIVKFQTELYNLVFVIILSRTDENNDVQQEYVAILV